MLPHVPLCFYEKFKGKVKLSNFNSCLLPKKKKKQQYLYKTYHADNKLSLSSYCLMWTIQCVFHISI